MSIFQSNTVKALAIATVVFAVQQFNSNDDAKTAMQSQGEFHKASLSCQNWTKSGHGELMGCK